jgi:hypothetical protein
LRKHRGTRMKRTLVTAIKCISADGRCIHPLIIWPASTHRSSWTTHATPWWHIACSKTGYTNKNINLYWVEHVFDPQTRDWAGGRPRLLICNDFGSHESLEVMKFCFANRIILCRLTSRSSHKLPSSRTSTPRSLEHWKDHGIQVLRFRCLGQAGRIEQYQRMRFSQACEGQQGPSLRLSIRLLCHLKSTELCWNSSKWSTRNSLRERGRFRHAYTHWKCTE